MTSVMQNKAETGDMIRVVRLTAMSNGRKILLVVAGLMIVGSLPTMSGCWHAYHDRSKVSIGMSVSDVFNAVDRWDLCLSTYLDETTKEFGMFNVLKASGEHTYRLSKYDKTIRSKEEFVQFVEKQMSNGQAWGSQFTYFAGPTRNTFRVDFDRNGKVINVAGMVGPP
jgi:hypothetical protein